MRRAVVLLFLSFVLTFVATAQEVGTLTLMEGSLRLIRGVMVMQAVEGIRLHQGDLLESSDRGFDQLELAGGTVVALGPSSRLFLLRDVAGRTSGSAEAPAAELILLSGWLKGETPVKSGAYRYACPMLGAATRDGTIVIHAGADAAEIFVEAGSASIAEVNADGNWHKIAEGKSGQFFSRPAGSSVSTLAKPSSAFIDSVPRAFKDTLPSRLSRFEGEPPQPVREHQATYAEIRPWLTIARAWRASFVRRFEPLLNNPAFRAALESHVNEYPEWDAVLHPKKYSPAAPDTAKSKPQDGSQH
jgi:hypothetical protein